MLCGRISESFVIFMEDTFRWIEAIFLKIFVKIIFKKIFPLTVKDFNLSL